MLRQLNIRKKLAVTLWGTALLAFAVSSVALALFGHLTLESRARQIMEPYAQLVSVGAEAAVAFEDSGRAQEILNTLRTNPQISEAEIFLRDGRLLAGYSSYKATFRPHPLKPDGVYLNKNAAELMQSLQDDAHLHLVMSLDELNRQTRNVLLVFAAGVLVLLVVVTLALLAALQRTIVHPISTLAKTVEQVRTRADYHQRVPASGADEVAQLGQSFNSMMGAIQERENDLRRLTLFQQTVLDSAAYGIISTAPDGIVTDFNPAAERLLGYTADEVVGKQTPACWHDPEEMARRAFQLSEEQGETIPPGFDVFVARPRRNLSEENEWIFIRKDGTRVPVLLSVTALRGESGEITGFVGMTYDLTERKRGEQAILRLNTELVLKIDQLEEAQEELVRKEKLSILGQLSGSVGHELRNPLGVMSNAVYFLKAVQGDADETVKEYLGIIENEIANSQRIITDLLDFARTKPPSRQAVTPGELVRQSLERCDIPENVTLTVEAPEDLPRLNIDALQMRQVLTNFITNGVQAMSGGGALKIDARRVGAGLVPAHEQAGQPQGLPLQETVNFVEISVADTGEGIAPENMKKLFQPLFTTKAKGIGLGLVVCMNLVEANGGRIEVESEVGKGTTFTVLLPAMAATASGSKAGKEN